MNSLIGFTISLGLSQEKLNVIKSVQQRALTPFDNFEHSTLQIGVSHLWLWGRKGISESIHHLPDGSILVLVGTPVGEVHWHDVQEKFIKVDRPEDIHIPWDGRVILLKISADGKCWTIWNDWLGSIPVFHADVENGRLASTLEPVTVSGAGFTSDDFFMPGLVSLLINGHYLSDWTLYKGMKVIPPDSMITWDKKGFSAKQLWTVEPSQSRWEAGWDDLVDEMYELSKQAILDTLKTQPKWILPLSSGLDSRLIAGVAANAGVDVTTYAWGGKNTTDVNYSRQIAKTLGLPWKHIEFGVDFLKAYTPQWANWFGSSVHFHGMYQMAFLDRIKSESAGAVLSGFIGEVLAGDSIIELTTLHTEPGISQLQNDWYVHWTVEEIRTRVKVPSLEDTLAANAAYLKDQIATLSGAWFQKFLLLELWNRQRFFTNFQSTLADYWRGVGNPFMNRAYARFCMSLPRVALDHRRLLGDVFRRYYGPLAVIPGTYAKDPFILTGKYLVMRRIAHLLPPSLHIGSLRGFGNVQLRMDIESVQATGKAALWPLFEDLDRLREWIDIDQLEKDYQAIMKSKEDIRPLRRLQSVQTLAYRLVQTNGAN